MVVRVRGLERADFFEYVKMTAESRFGNGCVLNVELSCFYHGIEGAGSARFNAADAGLFQKFSISCEFGQESAQVCSWYPAHIADPG